MCINSFLRLFYMFVKIFILWLTINDKPHDPLHYVVDWQSRSFVAIFGQKYDSFSPKMFWRIFFCQNSFPAILRQPGRATKKNIFF